jgi:hypothetical protein
MQRNTANSLRPSCLSASICTLVLGTSILPTTQKFHDISLSPKMNPHDPLATTPAMAPPSGQQANFEHPFDISKKLWAIDAVFMGTTTILFAMRLYTKLRILKRHGWEDCTLRFAKFYCTVTMILYGLQLYNHIHFQ